MYVLVQAEIEQASDDQLEKHIAALLECIGGVEKSRGPRGPTDYSNLHKEYHRDKDGVVRGRWVRNGQRLSKRSIAKVKGQEKKKSKANSLEQKKGASGGVSGVARQNESKALGNAENGRKPKRVGGGSTKGFLFSSLKDNDEKKAELAKKISGTIVAKVKAKSVPYNGDGKFAEAARAWIESNPQKNAKTVIGEVEIDASAVRADASHNISEGYMKLQTLPAVKNILEKGTYLGYETDFDGKPIDNHYFAGKIKYGDKTQIVFCRVRKNAGKNNRFYVHEIFTRKQIKAGAPKPKDGKVSSLRGKPLYQFILHDIFVAADRIAQRQKEKEASMRVTDPRLRRLSGSPPSSTLPQTDNSVNKKTEKSVKKSAKSKKWLWVDSNGKIWTRKSVLEAWRREMAGGL